MDLADAAHRASAIAIRIARRRTSDQQESNERAARASRTREALHQTRGSTRPLLRAVGLHPMKDFSVGQDIASRGRPQRCGTRLTVPTTDLEPAGPSLDRRPPPRVSRCRPCPDGSPIPVRRSRAFLQGVAEAIAEGHRASSEGSLTPQPKVTDLPPTGRRRLPRRSRTFFRLITDPSPEGPRPSPRGRRPTRRGARARSATPPGSLWQVRAHRVAAERAAPSPHGTTARSTAHRDNTYAHQT